MTTALRSSLSLAVGLCLLACSPGDDGDGGETADAASRPLPDAAPPDAAPDAGPPVESGPDRLLILNGKLSSAEDGYVLNRQGPDGRWIGSEVLRYDPARRGEVERLGRLDYGPDHPDFDLQQLVARELAWHPEHGLWGLFIDQGFADEWYLGHVEVPDPAATDQPLPTTLFAFRETDAAVYPLEAITGMAFFGDDLVLATPPEGIFPGALVRVSGPWPPALEAAPAPYYMAEDRAAALAELPQPWGVAGDLAVLGEARYALLHRGNRPQEHALARLDAGGAATVTGEGVTVAGDDTLTGLAAAGEALFATSLEGVVYRVDPETGAFERYDDLGPLLPPDERGESTRRLRGAAPFVLP